VLLEFLDDFFDASDSFGDDLLYDTFNFMEVHLDLGGKVCDLLTNRCSKNISTVEVFCCFHEMFFHVSDDFSCSFKFMFNSFSYQLIDEFDLQFESFCCCLESGTNLFSKDFFAHDFFRDYFQVGEKVLLEFLDDFLDLGDSFGNDFLHDTLNLRHLYLDFGGNFGDFGAHRFTEDISTVKVFRCFNEVMPDMCNDI